VSLYKADFVQMNKYSRPGTKLQGVKGIVIHWTANPGATAKNHKDFFDGSDGGGGRAASAHLFVDKTTSIQIIPFDEVAYHANDKLCKVSKFGNNANLNTIGIEMCVEKDGTIHSETIKRTVQITTHLCQFYKLSIDDIYRHYDITGKNCPAPWVSNTAAFEQFKQDVNAILNPVAVSIPEPKPKTVNPDSLIPFKVIIPNTAFWQARSLTVEFMARGYKAYGQTEVLGEPKRNDNNDPMPFVIETNYEQAVLLVKELQGKGYTKAFGEKM
jgi:N-acetylmuramoyl-L-alanine amidase